MLLEQLEKAPETINFKEVIAYIDENYDGVCDADDDSEEECV